VLDFWVGFGTMLMAEPRIKSIPGWDAFSYSTAKETSAGEIPSIPGGNSSPGVCML